ncbi:hypothetical protein [Aureivirga marina]|uniref:hypothetical protein n=1 Tax=Aureivirga marina TaxID=1182451 RepID=UPI0018C97800|nr:hypothetical protein [Aureivirga marina]
MRKLSLLIYALVFALLLNSCQIIGKEEPLKNKFISKIEREKNYFEKLQDYDISDFYRMKLLIGKQDVLVKNQVQEIEISGENSYLINEKGLITKFWNMSNSYNEIIYDENGKPLKELFKQHSPKFTYREFIYKYNSAGELVAVENIKYDEKTSKIEDVIIITDAKELNNLFRVFRNSTSNDSYKIDSQNKQLITFKSDLLFCCGKKMSGENKLTYFLNEKDLIDSLQIESLESAKKMKIKYLYK